MRRTFRALLSATTIGLLPLLSSCDVVDIAKQNSDVMGNMLICRNTFNSTFVAMSSSFEGSSDREKFRMLLSAVKERQNCDDRATATLQNARR